MCDLIAPWAHGTVVRATRYPTYYDFNLVRVEDDPGMSLEALVAFADEALAGLEHRRFDFDVVAVADALRPGFEALGWKTHAPGVDAPRVPAAARARHRGARGPLRRRARAARGLVRRGLPGRGATSYHAARARGRA